VQADEIFSDGGNVEDGSWDAIWESRGHINPVGYEVEMGIPFRSLQFQHSSGEQTWGFAPLRIYPRSQRLQIANFTHNRDNSCLLCQFHKLKGFSGAAPGKNVEIDPTITAFRTDARESSQDSLTRMDSKLDAGISGHWGITPNLTLSGTVNPDFSQVEADIAQLDINTQFALFYPEKRPFFLEGNDFFQTNVDAVYTRSVADPSWGVKLSGKEGANAIGLFMCRDEMTNILFPGAEGSQSATLRQGAMASVLRYRRDIGSSSTIGLLFTDREGTDYFNRLGGMDGLLRLGKSDTLRFQVLGSSTRYPGHIAGQFKQSADTFSGYALNLSYQRQTRSLIFYVDYSDFSPDFRADMGFIPQVNYRKGTISGNYLRWGKKGEFFSRFQAGAQLSYSQDYDGNILEKDIQFHAEMDMPLQSMLLIWAGARQRHFNSLSFNEEYFYGHFRIKPTGKMFIKFDFSIGDKVDYLHARPGKDLFLVPSIDLNIGKHLLMRLSYSYSDFKVDEGRLFNAHLLQGRLVYHFSKRAFLRGIIQYQDISRSESLYAFPAPRRSQNLFNQFLFSYKINPRTVLFLGYSDNYLGEFEVPLEQLNRTFFLKIGYALSL
jgi:hypothetical protein